MATSTAPFATIRQRNLLSGGLALTLAAVPAVLWTYLFSLVAGLLFSARFFGQWDALLSHSLAAQSLTSAFDIGTLGSGYLRLSEHVPGGNPPFFGGALVFAVVYFLLVPGTLFCYAAPAPARLSTLFAQGVAHFWRFVRITLLTLIVGGVLLGPMSALNGYVAARIDDHIVGRPAFVLDCIGYVILFLAASLVRLYFDLVEVYTVQLGLHVLPGGRSDRRVRLTLRPAWRTMTRFLGSAWLSFLLLSILGALAMAIATRFTVDSLAQPRVWPAFVVFQMGMLVMIFTRFWQRGAETVLARNQPLASPASPARSAYVPRSTGVAAPPAVPEAVEVAPSAAPGMADPAPREDSL